MCGLVSREHERPHHRDSLASLVSAAAPVSARPLGEGMETTQASRSCSIEHAAGDRSPEVAREAFSRSGYRPRAVAVLPCERQAMDYLFEDQLLKLDDDSIAVADDGVVIWLDSL